MERSRSLSLEEENELVRSTKKVKDSHYGINDDSSNQLGGSKHSSKLSFRDKLVGEIPGAYSQSFDCSEHMDAESESDEEAEDIREGFATITLSKEIKQRIRAPWTKALIVKVFGRTVGFNFLHVKLMSLWKPSGRLDMVDLGRDFFLIKFSVMEDLEMVLMKGPWFIGEHFLSIRRWEANFKPSEAQVSSVAIWVRINELPIEYYDAEVLRLIGRALGKVLRVDAHTATEARGRYARLCVQVDVSKPLITMVRIGQSYQSVVYERVNKLCFSCGRLGHRKETCQYTIKAPVAPPKATSALDDTEKADQTPPVTTTGTEDLSEARDTSGTDQPEETFGPWMVVTRKKKDNRGLKKSSETPLPGLRFDQQKMLEPLESSVSVLEAGGPNSLKGPDGKRKAQPERGLSPEKSPLLKENGCKSLSLGLANMSPVQTFNEGANHISGGVLKPKSHSLSVKGKRDAACNRVSLPSSSSADTTKNSQLAPSGWASDIANFKSAQKRDFKFGVSISNFEGDFCEESSLGLDGGPMAESPCRHTRVGGFLKDGVALDSTVGNDPDTLQSSLGGKAGCKKHLGVSSSCDDGREEGGSAGVLVHSDIGQMPIGSNSADDHMDSDFDGGGDISPTI